MVKSLRKALDVLLALILVIISLNGICGGAFGAPASVASNVLEDLQRDDSFNLDDYPAYTVYDDSSAEGFYRLEVIQIAESTDGELFVYVYQPAARTKLLVASSINIAPVPNSQIEAQSFKTFNLIELNSSGVFFKYKVKDYQIKSDSVRYYNISNITRPYSKDIDGDNADNQVHDDVDCAVGQLWTAHTASNGDVEYFNTVSEVIEITDKFVGFLRYYDAQGWLGDYFTDAHFVAFSTNIPMDRLYEIDIEFYKQSRVKVYGGVPNQSYDDSTTLGTAEKETVTVHHDEVDHNSGNRYGYNKYTWDKIRTTSDFLQSENNSYYKITESGTKDISNTEWAVTFYKSSVKAQSNTGTPITDIYSVDTDDAIGQTVNSTFVSRVIILRLKFEKDGIRYNLGVVDNRQTGSDSPINEQIPNKKSLLDRLCELLERITGIPALIWKIIICALPFIIFLPLLSIIFPTFGHVLLWIIKAVWWVVTLPLRAMVALFRKRKAAPKAGDKSNKAKTKAKKPKAGKTRKKQARSKRK